jgi:hypothetical protein
MRKVISRREGRKARSTGAPIVGAIGAVLAGVGVAMAPQVLRADAPAGRYRAMGPSVVDTLTGLEWQVTVPAATLDWSDAALYCTSLALNGNGWRLPSITEAATLIDDNRASPALDPTAFPSTPLGSYWTGSALAGYEGIDSWTISSYDGTILFFATTQAERVRCVRSTGSQNVGDGSVDGSADGSPDGSDGSDGDSAGE